MKQLLTTIALVVLSPLAFAQEESLRTQVDPESEPVQSAEVAAAAAEADAPDTVQSTRLETQFQWVNIFILASGQARLDKDVGTANDHFSSEVEIPKADFGAAGITRGNGFNDERVVIQVRRNGVLIWVYRYTFSRNFPDSITFNINLQGDPAPELQQGDRVKVFCNGRFILKGQFHIH